MAAAVLFHAFAPHAVSQLTPATPSSTKSAHTTNGTTISITAVAHGLEENMLVTLSGWTWVGGAAGVVNGTWIVKARTSADVFTIDPTACPGTGTNPTVVGTYKQAPHSFYGMRIPVSTYGAKLVLPKGFWKIKNTGKASDGSALAIQLAYRFADSETDLALPVGTFVYNTKASQSCINIDVNEDEQVEVRDSSNPLILVASAGVLVAFVRPVMRGTIG